MSTNGYSSWAVDLAEVWPIYSFQGLEWLMVIMGVAFWIGWHRIQIVREGEHLEKTRYTGDEEKEKAQLERY